MNNTEQFRRECEARFVLKMSDGKRQAYYRGVEAKRGTDAAHELVAEVKRQRKLLSKKQSLEMEA